jgi:hypothetical protein
MLKELPPAEGAATVWTALPTLQRAFLQKSYLSEAASKSAIANTLRKERYLTNDLLLRNFDRADMLRPTDTWTRTLVMLLPLHWLTRAQQSSRPR